MNSESQLKWDLFSHAGFRSLLRWRGFPLVFQLVALLAVAALALNAWRIGLAHSAEEVMTLRKTNLTTLLVWGLWWPAMIAVVLGLGRVWCTVCPIELVNRAGDAVARRFRWPRARLGPWVRAGWFIFLGYLLLQVLVSGVSIHRVPHYTSVMLIVLGAAALISGLAFREPRSFCKGFCPAQALLPVYGRYTSVQLEVKDPQVCAACTTRECVDPARRYAFDGRSCPSLLAPFERAQSDACVLCFQCAKVCPHENVGFGVVRAAAGVRQNRLLRPFEAAFVMVAAGFVAHEVIGEVKWLDKFFHAVPSALHAQWPALGFGWFEGLWFLLLFPAVLWGLTAALAYPFSRGASLKRLLLAAATGAAPVVAMAHLAKAVAKLSSWGGYLPHALADPAGVDTFDRIAAHALATPERLVSFPLVGWVMLLAMLVIGWRSWRWTRQAAANALAPARVAFAVVALLFGAVLTTWLA